MGEGRRRCPRSHTRLVLERRGRNPILSLLSHRLIHGGLGSAYYSIEGTDGLLRRWILIVFRRVFYQIGELFVAFGALLFRHASLLVAQLGDLRWSQFWISCRLWQIIVRDCMLESWVSFRSWLIITKWGRWVLTSAEEPERWLATARIMFQYLVSAPLIPHFWCLTI